MTSEILGLRNVLYYYSALTSSLKVYYRTLGLIEVLIGITQIVAMRVNNRIYSKII